MSFLGSIAKAGAAQILGRGARSIAKGLAKNVGNIAKGISRGAPKVFKGIGADKVFKGAKALGRQARTLPFILSERIFKPARPRSFTASVRTLSGQPAGPVGKDIARDLRGVRLIGETRDIVGSRGASYPKDLLRNLRANYAESATGGRFGAGSKVLRAGRSLGGQGVNLAAETAIDQLVGRGIMGLGGAVLGAGSIAGGTALGNKLSGKKKKKKSN